VTTTLRNTRSRHFHGMSAEARNCILERIAAVRRRTAMRAQCMGVLAQFDLDVVMTSESEWGCYTTVPGLTIYHLTAMPGIDAVAATRWVWNGRERRQTDVVQARATAPDEAVET
jgi:hypothetical protein